MMKVSELMISNPKCWQVIVVCNGETRTVSNNNWNESFLSLLKLHTNFQYLKNTLLRLKTMIHSQYVLQPNQMTNIFETTVNYIVF